MERNRQEFYQSLSPAERNTELGKIFSAIPKTSLFDASEVFTDTDKAMESMNDMLTAREKSEVKQVLTSNLQLLLDHSFLTSNAQAFLGTKFRDFYEFGFTQAFPEDNHDILEIANILGYGQPGSVGVFAPESSRPIEQSLYHVALRSQMLVFYVNSELEKNDTMMDLLKGAVADDVLLQASKGIMTDEEKAKFSEQEKKEDEIAREMILRHDEWDSIMDGWRQAYFERYHDEP